VIAVPEKSSISYQWLAQLWDLSGVKARPVVSLRDLAQGARDHRAGRMLHQMQRNLFLEWMKIFFLLDEHFLFLVEIKKYHNSRKLENHYY